ncbi:nucleic acid/nucleotide deaminase domain-containing protein [Kitasatospora sp. NPDC002227]|uniref:nucleic acid/nucleotide deaminase domain-containing protein n=1 Tax=Kitasatospora sp. NPDC002227 TaxID=3154773 RepID=UPI003329A8F2
MPGDTSAEALTGRFGADGLRRFGPAAGPAAGLVLPLQVGPYFHTLEEEPALLPEYADLLEEELADPGQRSWARIGSDRAYDLVVDPGGEVRALLIGYREEPLKYVNSSAAAFAAGLLGLDLLLDTLGSEDPQLAAAEFHRFEEQLRAADPAAFADRESWWPLVLDDIRDTSATEWYAAFEVVDEAGAKEIFTSSGAVCIHPEERLWARLEAAGVEPDQVVRIFTELQACNLPGHYCSMWLALTFPDAEVTHSFDYGESAASREQGIRELRAAAAERAGGA